MGFLFCLGKIISLVANFSPSHYPNYTDCVRYQFERTLAREVSGTIIYGRRFFFLTFVARGNMYRYINLQVQPSYRDDQFKRPSVCAKREDDLCRGRPTRGCTELASPMRISPGPTMRNYSRYLNQPRKSSQIKEQMSNKLRLNFYGFDIIFHETARRINLLGYKSISRAMILKIANTDLRVKFLLKIEDRLITNIRSLVIKYVRQTYIYI